MRLSAYFLAAVWAAGLAIAEASVSEECWNPDLSLNATNVDVLANCTLYTYQCVGGDTGLTFVTTPPPPPNCTTKTEYNVFFSDYNMTGPLVVPRMVETDQISFQGLLIRNRNSSGGIDREVRPLRVDSIEFPDLVNITESGMFINYATNVSSLKLPKLENIRGSFNLDLSGGPAISLSFPSLRIVQYSILIQGKIDELSFPALNSSQVINITSTGDLDCVAFAATVVNTTLWPTGFKEIPESLECTSNKNSIKTHPVPAEDTSGSIDVSWFRGDFLLLAVLVGSMKRALSNAAYAPNNSRGMTFSTLTLGAMKKAASEEPPQCVDLTGAPPSLNPRRAFGTVPPPVPVSVSAPLQTYEGWNPAAGGMGYGVGISGQELLPQFQAGAMGAVGSQQMMQAGWQVPYPFQDGGIFGMGGEPYLDLPPGGEYMDPFVEGYGHVGDQEMGFDAVMAQDVNVGEVSEECSMSQDVYEKLTAELPVLTKLYLGDRVSLLQLYNHGLDYSNLCMPFFHRPTLNLENLPPQLILTICSLGACTSDDEAIRETGKAIHTHVWRQTFLAAMDARQVDVWTLQTMVLLEHIGFYALSRSAHEKADVFHAMVVTLARRSSLLAQNFDSSNGSRLSLEKQWEEWAERETIIRVAYTIFIHDVDYTIHFMHPALLTLGMLKLPLPSPPSLWLVKSAADWSRQTKNSRPPPRTSSLRTLRSALELLIPVHCTHSRPRRRATLQLFCSSAFTLQILVHGLASAVFEHKFRGVEAGYSPSLQLLQIRDFEEGLASWMVCFERLAPETGCTELARSALVTYHFTSILLRESLSDILMAAGTAYSWGRAVTPQRAQDAFLPLVSTQPVGQDAYRHALKILSLCVEDEDGTANSGGVRRVLHPLYLTYNTFIAVLVLWAYALGLSRTYSAKAGEPQPVQALWAVQSGKLKKVDPAGRARVPGTRGNEAAALSGILERGFAKPEIGAEEIERIRGDVRGLMRMVRGRLEGSAWELSHEAMRVLDALLDKNGFMD
ncbi:hypothetical protein VE03_05224 [Pseudogymnoascus sp. 23342-1-I1]|nr:hypothetical protein VE03_05224 [Pseudogymnoascus sp. 23342-1-I1]